MKELAFISSKAQKMYNDLKVCIEDLDFRNDLDDIIDRAYCDDQNLQSDLDAYLNTSKNTLRDMMNADQILHSIDAKLRNKDNIIGYYKCQAEGIEHPIDILKETKFSSPSRVEVFDPEYIKERRILESEEEVLSETLHRYRMKKHEIEKELNDKVSLAEMEDAIRKEVCEIERGKGFLRECALKFGTYVTALFFTSFILIVPAIKVVYDIFIDKKYQSMEGIIAVIILIYYSLRCAFAIGNYCITRMASYSKLLPRINRKKQSLSGKVNDIKLLLEIVQ